MVYWLKGISQFGKNAEIHILYSDAYRNQITSTYMVEMFTRYIVYNWEYIVYITYILDYIIVSMSNPGIAYYKTIKYLHKYFPLAL